jgi:hypothetical protein
MAGMRTTRGEGAFEHETRERGAEHGGLPTSWLLAGAAIALGAWAVYHFGPDFRRYIKMEIM